MGDNWTESEKVRSNLTYKEEEIFPLFPHFPYPIYQRVLMVFFLIALHFPKVKSLFVSLYLTLSYDVLIFTS